MLGVLGGCVCVAGGGGGGWLLPIKKIPTGRAQAGPKKVNPKGRSCSLLSCVANLARCRGRDLRCWVIMQSTAKLLGNCHAGDARTPAGLPCWVWNTAKLPTGPARVRVGGHEADREGLTERGWHKGADRAGLTERGWQMRGWQRGADREGLSWQSGADRERLTERGWQKGVDRGWLRGLTERG